MVSRTQSQNKIYSGKKRTSQGKVVVSFFFCQANFIMVPFPAYRQQVLSRNCFISMMSSCQKVTDGHC